MPSGYAQRLSSSEIQDLVAYLKTLNGRDFSKTIQAEIPGGLSFERIRNSASEPHNWLTYWGDYQGHHFSVLKEINTANVRQLQARWTAQMPGDSVLESTPLVVDGIMYVSGQPGQVYALDARTGLTIWRYQRTPKVVRPNQTNRFNRGVAVLGNRVFFGTLDAALVALDARNGQPLWETFIGDTRWLLDHFRATGAQRQDHRGNRRRRIRSSRVRRRLRSRDRKAPFGDSTPSLVQRVWI
jgi:glucose dehydrogenase